MPSVRLSTRHFTHKLPDTPGVYFFRDGRGKVLYIGRATSLRDRVRSYFGMDIESTRGPLIGRMVRGARSISWQEADSVLEAIILEANLIKKFRPLFNTKEKDDKSFNYVVITKERFPRVLVVRGRELSERFPARSAKHVFGPFPYGGVFREAMKIIRKIFPFRDTCQPALKVPQRHSNILENVGMFSLEGKVSMVRGHVGKPCFNRQLGLCPGVCTGEITEKEYAKSIRHLKLFFAGKKRELVRALERDMRARARQRKFEQASGLKRQIFALAHIRDVALVKDELRGVQGASSHSRIEGYDVAHTAGTDTVGVMVVVEDSLGKKSEYRKFKVRAPVHGSDTAALAEVFERRLGHPEWLLPTLMVVDGGAAQRNVVLRILDRYGYRIPVVGVVKDERHRPERILGDRAVVRDREREILLANAEAHRYALKYHSLLRGKKMF